MTITKMVAFVQGKEDRLKEEERLQRKKEREFSKRAKSTGNFNHGGSQAGGNRQFFKKSKSGPAPSLASAPVQRSKFNKKNQNFRTTDSQSQASVGYRVPGNPICNTCGNHGGSQAGGNRQFFKKSKSGPAPSSASAPVQRSKFNKKNKNFRTADSQSQASVGYRVPGYPICNTCEQWRQCSSVH
ncbi:hypothetical protein A4A49_54004 [Nicotiana attenuata]|uniref:Uncharacterized protein n=1 Tax=Nicotiana attenuata TaxID=49451 RepID=A0A314KSF6_NICAT|nr:hypothetical protein A4A49_54004 [Nicotiana attenuata]